MLDIPLKAGNAVPAQDPVNHLQFAFAPKEPPATVRVMLSPRQMLLKSRFDVIESACADCSSRVTTKLQVDVLL